MHIFNFTQAPAQDIQTSTPTEMSTPKGVKLVNNKNYFFKKYRFYFSSVHNLSLSSLVVAYF